MTDPVRQAFATHMDSVYGAGYRARYKMGEWWEDPSCADEWATWLASRAAALEEAVKACGDLDELAVEADWYSIDDIAFTVKRACVAAIRALAQGDAKRPEREAR